MAASIPEVLSTALRHHKAGRLQEADELYQQVLEIQPDHPDALHLAGMIAQQVGQHHAAIDYISRAIRINPSVAEYQNNLGEALRANGKLEEAAARYRQALTLKPTLAAAHSNLGNVLNEQGKTREAEASYRRALELDPTAAEVYSNLGNVLRAQGRLAEAVACCRRAVMLKPSLAEACNNLGVALEESGMFEEAIAQYRQAIALKPSYAEAYNNLGNVLKAHGVFKEAEGNYRQAMSFKPKYAEACNNLGGVLEEQGKFDEAVACYRQALTLNPALAEVYTNLGKLLRDQGKLNEAMTCYQQALALQPNDGLRIGLATMLPVIVGPGEEVAAIRKKFDESVSSLLMENLVLEDPAREVGQTNFCLAYHGLNDRELQVKVSRLYERACPSLAYTATHCLETQRRHQAGKIKIGFISRFLFNHSVAITTRGVLAMLSREQFTVCAIGVAPVKNDESFRFIRQHAEQTLIVPNNLQMARERIAAERLDVLYYLDIGMEPLTYSLAFARLAPVQCVFPGHPVTTGIRNMDYFISSDGLEPSDADAHYSERLVRFKRLPMYFYRPQASSPTLTRRDFGFGEDEHVYLCPQTLFKFHPDFDAMLGDILRADPLGRVTIVDSPHKHWSLLLRRRFENTIPDVVDRIRFLPRQNGQDFLRLLEVSDVVLDTIHFGGGSTSLMALGMGAPVVTLPGHFMRGRVTYACYRQMGMLDCVASTQTEYVKLALHLGTDAFHREQVRARILAANHLLYEDGEVVKEFERFFREAVEKRMN